MSIKQISEHIFSCPSCKSIRQDSNFVVTNFKLTEDNFAIFFGTIKKIPTFAVRSEKIIT